MQKIVVSVLVLIMIVVGCSSDNDVSSGDIQVSKVKFSLCGENTNATRTNVSEYIKFSAVNNNTLKVEHKILLNCCVENIGITLNSEENKITISITDDIACNCICPRIVSYEISNLQAGNTYKLTFLKAYSHATEYYTIEYYTCTLLFSSQVNREIRL